MNDRKGLRGWREEKRKSNLLLRKFFEIGLLIELVQKLSKEETIGEVMFNTFNILHSGDVGGVSGCLPD